ncbi:hypothetical protein [Amycolatopsis sp. GA6-003]|uniref:hypothetical protein n=1 Tax=Amycolatopsis sp. GA6-003 TaxID=2652444 RepID=UPI003916F772
MTPTGGMGRAPGSRRPGRASRTVEVAVMAVRNLPAEGSSALAAVRAGGRVSGPVLLREKAPRRFQPGIAAEPDKER